MKLIIDIPELAYDRLLGEQHIPNIDYEYLIIHGTPIPDNATNGDVIRALYPNADYYQYYSDCIEGIEMESAFSFADFDRKWWNAPYQKGGTNGND